MAYGQDHGDGRRSDPHQRLQCCPRGPAAFIHRSLDGTRVTNYAQWQSREAFEAMLGDPEAAEHMGEAARIAERFEPHLYEVSFVEEV